MAHQINIELICDKCGKKHYRFPLDAAFTTIEQARASARVNGWAFSRNKDICAYCRQRKPKGWDKEDWLTMRPDLEKNEEQ